MLNFAILLPLAAATAAWYLFKYLYASRPAPNEPPVVSHPIPYIGHILGLLRHGLRYYQITSAKCKSPIYTLNVLGGRIYVVVSPDLINAVSRNAASIAFNPFIAQLGQRLTGADQPNMAIVNTNLNSERGHWGFVIETHDGTVAAMAPGKDLDHMNGVMLQQASKHFQELDQDEVTVNLYAWAKHIVTICSTTAVYGVNNPFSLHPELEDAFWDYDQDINSLLVNIAPTIIARKAYKSREKLALAFKRYFEDNPRDQSSALTNARYNANTKYGLTSMNMGRLEVGTVIGILANTVPSLFYMFAHIYSDRTLLEDLRSELKAVVSDKPNERGQITQCLNVYKMKEKCVLLNSTFQEVLRVHSLGASARLVLQDTMLNNEYLLKKGSIVQMPNSVIHSNPWVWGQNAKDFEPRRFLTQYITGKEPKRTPAAAFRPFGGGSTVCPGRHFASTEILSLTAMMILRFDMAPEAGQWLVPTPQQKSIATAVFPPKADIKVRIKRREGLSDTDWSFVME